MVTTQPLFKEFTALLDERMGLYYPEISWKDLEKKLIPLMHSRGFSDMNACVTWLVSSLQQKKQIADLALHLTKGETSFFRDHDLFAVLEAQLLPKIIECHRKERQLRIWSAGCSTGEEPYSIAMLLHRLLPDIKEWNIYLLATDINPYFLTKAIKARYLKKAAYKPFIQDYFHTLRDGSLELKPEIKNMVTFANHNLVADDQARHHFSRYDMDLILCSHVLIDFSPRQITYTMDQLVESLKDGGWLGVAPIEVPLVHHSSLTMHRFDKAVFFNKPESRTETKPRVGKRNETAQSRLEQLKKQPQALKRCAKEASLLVRRLINQGKIDQALEWCEAVLAVEKLDPLFHYLHAEIHLARVNIPEAIKAAKRALFLNPEFVAAHYLLGLVEEKQGHLALAKKQFKIALRLLDTYSPDVALPGTDSLTAAHIRKQLNLDQPRPSDSVQ